MASWRVPVAGRALVEFNQTSVVGGPFQDYVAVHTKSPSAYYGATLTQGGGNFIVTRRDGTRMEFNVFGGDLVRVSDRFGRAVEITRSGGLISRIATQSGRFVDAVSDGLNRISDLTDMGGHHWGYRYNGAGYLDQVTYPDTTKDNFTYDPQGRMTDVDDRRREAGVRSIIVASA